MKFIVSALFLLIVSTTQAQSGRWIQGMYLQWGYNTEAYTKSNIRFRMDNGDKFELHHAKAHDRRDWDDIYKETLEISIPQYNYRFGFYLNKQHSRAFEINFDHAKYIVTDGQNVHVTGTIDGAPVNGDSVLNPQTFLHFEHTDGANWLNFNYVQQHVLSNTKRTKRPLLTYLWKAGAGFNIPRTDFTWRGSRLNNNFHIAGYNVDAEADMRLYPFRHFFVELVGKTGYARYINALADTRETKGNRASHGIGFVEAVGLFGYDINF